MSSTFSLPSPHQSPHNPVQHPGQEFDQTVGQDVSRTAKVTQRNTREIKRLLLVEDDPSTSNALRQLLTAHGYQVATVGTVAAALEAVDDSLWGVILDLMLPDGDGAEVLRKIRSVGIQTRVCITTGVSSPMWLDRVKALSPDCILQKPIDLARLLEKL